MAFIISGAGDGLPDISSSPLCGGPLFGSRHHVVGVGSLGTEHSAFVLPYLLAKQSRPALVSASATALALASEPAPALPISQPLSLPLSLSLSLSLSLPLSLNLSAFCCLCPDASPRIGFCVGVWLRLRSCPCWRAKPSKGQ